MDLQKRGCRIQILRMVKPPWLLLLLGLLHSGRPSGERFIICPWDEYQSEDSGSGLLLGPQ
jgi:hypothetical protein